MFVGIDVDQKKKGNAITRDGKVVVVVVNDVEFVMSLTKVEREYFCRCL